MPLYAPTAQVRQLLAMTPQHTLVLDSVPYSFTRRVRWTTLKHWYADARPEVLGKQLLKLQEFVIRRENWTPDEIAALQDFVDVHKGAAYPFYFTAPDDGQTYVVRFREDQVEYSVPSAVVRTGELVLVEAGDMDNTINNYLVYPDYAKG